MEQVAFECNGMHCVEVLNLPLDAMRVKGGRQFDARVPTVGAFKMKTVGEDPWKIMEYIHDFTLRQLTYETDALNAIRGVFHVFEKSSYPVLQLMGVPIMPGIEKSAQFVVSRSAENGFLIGLLWWHEPTSYPCFRRTMFPSWSWVGWDGPTTEFLQFNEYSIVQDLDAQVFVELPDGSLLRFPISMDEKGISSFLPQAQKSKFIHLTARTSAYNIVKNDIISNSQIPPVTPYYATLVSDDEINISLPFFADGVEQGEERDQSCSPCGTGFTAIIFACGFHTGRSPWQMSVIVVQEIDHGRFMERFGVCGEEIHIADVSDENIPFLPNSYYQREGSDMDAKLSRQQALQEWYHRRSFQTIRLG